jgi:membrane-associated phospholipid phosphatase
VTLAELNAWAIAMIAPYNFGLKWYAGRARPEEIVWYIAKRPASELVASGVPADIVSEIHAMNLNSPLEFTAYPEGSPPHPAWPAMHSAASVVSFWLPVVMNLTQAQICEAKALDYGVAYGRSISGVHFPTDNSVGLNLGQELLVRKLPTLLKERFGANIDTVEGKWQL